MDSQRIYTVSEINGSIKHLLEHRFPYLSVAGEISNLRRPYSGHLYFSLKDRQAQIKAVLFKMQQRYLLEQPADGLEVICHGRISVYEPRGDYQLIVDTIDFHGSGALQAAFEQLKRKLDAEGLFDRDKKKKIPDIPEHITLITSPEGAAVHDFIRIAQRRFPASRLAVYPVAVQGPQAAEEIIQALDLLNKSSATGVIVLCRGGGSIEDLQAYNEERLARAISASTIPVVSAVGHEIDFTIADFVSDLRAATPSAAAELLLPDREVLRDTVTSLQNRMILVQERRIDRLSDKLALQRQRLGDMSTLIAGLFLRVDQQSMLLVHRVKNILREKQQQTAVIQLRLERHNPRQRLRASLSKVKILENVLVRAMQRILSTRTEKLQRQLQLLEAVGPANTLARGYAIIRKKTNMEVVTDSTRIAPGEQALVFLDHGSLEVTVDRCSSENPLSASKKSTGE